MLDGTTARAGEPGEPPCAAQRLVVGGEQERVDDQHRDEDEEQPLLDGQAEHRDPGAAGGADRPDPVGQREPVGGAQPQRHRQPDDQPVEAVPAQQVAGDGALQRERRRDPDQQQPEVAGLAADDQQRCSGQGDGEPGQRAGRPVRRPRDREPSCGEPTGAHPDRRHERDEQDDEGVLLGRHAADRGEHAGVAVGPDAGADQVLVPGGRPGQRDDRDDRRGDQQPPRHAQAAQQQDRGQDEEEQVEQPVVHAASSGARGVRGGTGGGDEPPPVP
jgi:hypothetical protein